MQRALHLFGMILMIAGLLSAGGGATAYASTDMAMPMVDCPHAGAMMDHAMHDRATPASGRHMTPIVPSCCLPLPPADLASEPMLPRRLAEAPSSARPLSDHVPPAISVRPDLPPPRA